MILCVSECPELRNIKRKGKKEKESPDMEVGRASVFSQVGNICSLYDKAYGVTPQ